MQGQAFLVTFAAIGKSDLPRADMERAGRKRQFSFRQTLRQAQGKRGSGTHPHHSTALTLTLPCRPHSRKHALAVPAAGRMRPETPPTPRAAGEGTERALADKPSPIE